MGLLCLGPRWAEAQQRTPPLFPADSAGERQVLAEAPVQVRQGLCLSPGYSVALPVGAVAVFAAPVAALAALVAHRRTDAVAGALGAGALYAGGATVAVATNCAPRAVFAYLGTPFAATLGALIGGAWGR